MRSIKRKMGTAETVTMGGREYLPQEISALILKKLKQVAEKYYGESITEAVITVPAYFTDAQRQATKDAGEIAGFKQVRIINEPTAAALVYSVGLERGFNKVLVYDLGGGTFDVSVVEVTDGVVEVLATTGNNHLGGDDFDRRIADHLAEYFYREHGVDLRLDKRAMARLLQVAEETKIQLSQQPFVTIQESFIAEKDGKPLHLEFELSRERFEHLIGDLLELTLELADKALAEAGLTADDIDEILLVGGSTRIPAVARLLKQHMGRVPSGEVHPDECVALGAAIQAGIVSGEDVHTVLVDVAPYSLGIAVIEQRFGILYHDRYSVIIPRNTPIPTTKSEVYTTIVDNQSAVEVEVYQGESPNVKNNVLLGKFLLEDLPPAPAGEPKIIVTFDYDVDGIVHVSARDKKTGREQKITIKDRKERMSEEEKARAQAAVASLEEEPELPPSAKAMVEKAREMALTLDDDQAEELLELADQLVECWRRGDKEEAEEVEEQLIDLLYELEE